MRNRDVGAVVNGLPKRTATIALCTAGLLAACNSLDARGVDGDSKVVIPTDTRASSQALRTLPAISGGTLKLTGDDAFAVVADPDRDRVSIVGLTAEDTSVKHIALEAGDEPGRVDIHSGRAYVALRGSGDLITIDIARAELVSRTHVCAAPRGVAVEPQTGMVHVACAEGRLVSLSLVDESVQRDLRMKGDLRDVLVTSGGLHVSTFKSSQLLKVDAAGNETLRAAPADFNLSIEREADEIEQNAAFIGDALDLRPMQPHIAWRSVEVDGSVLMLHQASAAEEVDITKPRKAENGQVSSPYGGGGALGGGIGCQGVVVTALSRFGDQGHEQTVALDGTVLAVDMAAWNAGNELAIVEAGTADEEAPLPTVVSEPDGSETITNAAISSRLSNFTEGRLLSEVGDKYKFASRLIRVPLSMVPHAANLSRDSGTSASPKLTGCTFGNSSTKVPGQATAVAYTATGTLVVQSREPALVTLIPNGAQPRVIDLQGDTLTDTGHELFHRDAGGGIACASCHAEGAEDGHTWNFTGQGVRRTQALHVGLAGTAPFHWAGDESDINVLMEDVFVGRMGGVHQSEQRVGSLTKFLFALKPPTASRDPSDPAAMRGKALFESAAIGCTSCHTGAKLTDNKSYDVGTSSGAKLQVPSLRGVGYRAPFIHTGCATTLRDRFDPACGGGAKHGNTADLSQPQIDDLVAFLETL
jgi:Cytochrome c